MRNVLNILLLLLLILGCQEKSNTEKAAENTALPFFNSAELTPEWIDEKSDIYKDIHTIPAFNFTNQNGKQITNEDYKGKIYIADFFFTNCPGICPKLTKQMNTLQVIYEDDEEVMLLSHSVMPWIDSVAVLKSYANKNNVLSSKWNLVTGNRDELYKIARNGYFADEDYMKIQDESAFIHTENFILVDKQGRIRGVYNGTLAVEVERIKKHIKFLKQES